VAFAVLIVALIVVTGPQMVRSATRR
jgi:hypothetical protein